MGHEYIIEMLNITKDFPGIRLISANLRSHQEKRTGSEDQHAKRCQ